MIPEEKTALKRNLQKALGHTLRQLREQHKGRPRQEVLAKRAAMDVSYWGCLERGERSLTLFNLWRVAAALGITPSRLVLAIDRNYHEMRGAAAQAAPPLYAPEMRRLRKFMDQLPTMKWLADRKQNCVYANRPLLEYLGCTFEEIAGLEGQGVIHPEDREGQMAFMRKAYRRRRPSISRFRVRRANGEYVWLVQHAVPQFNSKGEFIGFLGTMIPEPSERAGFGVHRPSGG